MRHLAIILISIMLYSLNSFANCGSIISELRAMKQAQSSIQMSLVSNHNLFAQTLESYSEALHDSGGKAFRTISKNMNNSVSSIRDRGTRANETSVKLEEATEDLIQRIAKCLK